MYVYQITNNINQKKYIGITNNYKKRWENEKCNPKDPSKQQVITRAIAKYGSENFTFTVLFSHLSIEEACDKEQELIAKLNTLIPNGYNIDKGGRYHPSFPPQFGENNGRACLTDAEALYIKEHRDQPMYVLYEQFSDHISYEAFKKCYKHQTYTHLPITKAEYPYNREFSAQFGSSPLEYDEIISIRERYALGEHWKSVYEDYKHLYTNEMSFWRLYTGLTYKLIKPEVFTPENKRKHASKGQGTKNSRAVLNESQVLEIRALHNKGVKNTEIYLLFPQVSSTSIRDIINGKTWKHLL